MLPGAGVFRRPSEGREARPGVRGLACEDMSPDDADWRRPRVGHIQFLNCLPIYWGLMRSGALLGVDLHKDTPDQLNAALVSGDLDIGPISLVEYLRHADELLLLPDLAVGSDGPVQSVLMVSTVDPSELDGRRVALGSTSRTGVLLARMWLESRLGVRPEYFRCPPDLGQMLLESDAAIVIGDVALRAHHDAPELGLFVTDLGAAWRDWTGLPMVFAVWAVRRDFATAHPGVVKEVHEAFLASRELCLSELDTVAVAAARWEPFSVPTLAAYFRAIDFSLGERQVAGLREFASRAAAAGEAPNLPADGPLFFTSTS
jgi:chorismate dehydratase